MAFEIAAVDRRVYWALFIIALVVVATPLLVLGRDGPARTLRNVVRAALLIVPLTTALGYTMSDSALRIEDGKVIVHAAHFFQEERPIGEFDLAHARAGTYGSMAEARLGVRSTGIRLPGYVAGRFARQGGGAMFALLTDRSRVVYLPARSGPSLLISVEQPEEFLAALRRVGALCPRVTHASCLPHS